MVAYGEFRQSFEKDPVDKRILFYGIRYVIENYVAVKWTLEDVKNAELFYKTHNAGNTEYPFPRNLFEKIVTEHGGNFPCIIESLPEGSCIYPHVPVYQITMTGEFSVLCTWLETMMTMLWYPSTVATLSRSRLHDFGFRGCTTLEQSVVGGCAHLLNFTGSDTMSAAYYAQFHLNNGKPVGESIPATEHSIMTSWSTEREALKNLIEQYGSGVFACVMDSYDYTFALEKVLPSVAKIKMEKGGLLVLRPDSGDPVETVIQALKSADSVFGSKVNKKGFKVLNGCAVIQGDGINSTVLKSILSKTLESGFSAQNVAFGMGGGLLQKVNRDTMSFATKLNHLVFKDAGESRDVMKMPKSDSSKTSLPGELTVCLNGNNVPIVYPKEKGKSIPYMEVVYNHGKIKQWDLFDVIRNRVETQWNKLPKAADVLSDEIKDKIEDVRTQIQRRKEHMLQ